MLNQDKPYTFDRVIRIAISFGIIYGLILALGYLSDVLTPFVIALLLAYLINPLVRVVQKKIPNRIIAVFLSLLIVVTVFCLVGLLLIPMIVNEVTHMGTLIREVVENSDWRNRAAEFLPANLWQTITDWAEKQNIQEFFMTDNFWKIASSVAKKVLPGTWGIITGTASFLLGLVGLVVIGLYLVFLLFEYQTISRGWKDLIPPAYRDWVVGFVSDFNGGMSRYFRAQASVAAIVGFLFAVGFTLIGLPMGILLGLLVGLLNMVPYLQLIALPPALLLAMVRALETGGSFWIMLGLVLLVFGVVQLIQDAIIVPKIMGDVTGLSPAIILLSLSIWGKLLGIFGLIIGLPMTCLILAYYKRLFIREPSSAAAQIE